MNNPDELRNARKEKVIILDKFIKIYPKNKEKIFCFHEGKMDDKYYGTIVDLKVSSETYYFCCGGKSNVLNMRRK